jgi:hypothetical protein
MLIFILVVFFICLIVYQLFIILAGKRTLEGFTYKPYSPPIPTVGPANSSSFIEQNINNIQAIEEELGGSSSLLQEVQDLSMNVQTLNQQMQSIVQAQSNATQQLVGTTPLNVTN